MCAGKGVLPTLLQQRYPNPSACVTCFVLLLHLARNAPAPSEICAFPQKNLTEPHTFPKAVTRVWFILYRSSGTHPRWSEKLGLPSLRSCQALGSPPALPSPACESEGGSCSSLLSCRGCAALKPLERPGPAVPSWAILSRQFCPRKKPWCGGKAAGLC